MEKILTLLISLAFCLFSYSNESFAESEDDKTLNGLIKGEKTYISDSLNPGDSLYRVLVNKGYDLNGNPCLKPEILVRIFVFPSKAPSHRTLISQYNINEYRDYEFIYQRELNRVLKWIDKLDIPKLIKDKEPCMLNGLEYAGILELAWVYDIVPKTAEKATVENDSINGE